MKLTILAVFAAILAVATAYVYFRYPAGAKSAQAWNANAVVATYVGAQLKEIDSSNAVLLLSYDLENNTASDFHFADGPATVVMSRLNSDDSLSSKEDIRLSDATFLPSHQRTRIELQIRHAFNWPAEGDPALENKLKDFVNQRLADVDEFVLFDQADRCQIEFPKGWQALKVLSAQNR